MLSTTLPVYTQAMHVMNSICLSTAVTIPQSGQRNLYVKINTLLHAGRLYGGVIDPRTRLEHLQWLATSWNVVDGQVGLVVVHHRQVSIRDVTRVARVRL